MYSITLREALETLPYVSGHFLYLYRDGEVNFYVGRAIHPIERLEQHLGTWGNPFNHSCDLLGRVIRKNCPASLDWRLDLFTLKDCQPLIGRNSPFPSSVNVLNRTFYKRTLKKLEITGGLYDRTAVEMAEQALINAYHPCLNVTGTIHYNNDLPAKYGDPYRIIDNENGADAIIDEIIGTKYAGF